MKTPRALVLCCIAYLLVAASCNDGGFNIIGGQYDFYADSNYETFLSSGCIWGNTSSSPSSKTIEVTSTSCWNQGIVYCRLKLVVSTLNVPNGEHYQIMGSNTIVMDKRSLYVIERFGWGMHESAYGFQDVTVAHGYLWSHEIKDWGYGYLHLYVQRTTRPSLTDAFWVSSRNSDSEQFSTYGTPFGEKEVGSSSHLLSRFRSWTTQWQRNSISFLNIITAQTKLVDYTVVYEEMRVEQLRRTLVESLTLKNQGSAVTANNFARLNSSDTLKVITQTRISTIFDFPIDIGSRVTVDISFLGAPLNLDLRFDDGSTFDMAQSTQVTDYLVEWPSECPPGLSITNAIYKNTKRHTVPIEFTFERLGKRWTERKTLEATVNSLEQQLTNCCLYNLANDHCGQTNLPICLTSNEIHDIYVDEMTLV